MSEYGRIIDAGTVRIERLLPGPIERVWAYLTESEKRGKWLASGEMELREGGYVHLQFRNASLSPQRVPPPKKYEMFEPCVEFTGRVTACDPPRLLSYTWGGEKQNEDSEVTFELSTRGDDVLLVITHRRLIDRDEMISVSSGWHTHLDILVDRLNGRDPKPFWPVHEQLEAEYTQRVAAELDTETGGLGDA